ncbi:DUF29 domain-containing protein [Candidatus Synechococcus calcipolaris G9]|uniref:DUF29 domain-containing protein n=1 Tax=Candidatus Synechococcus calcipolaris G9 TaxID=1497997 RepID=A0ABT6EWM1_9SYNE|nr:DUF29 domain-containing protein [Candidatus Synechococcus calcipolaris]MDG2990174.1 DUF29 domain-containing protein [Candidatus Synechococcus calcipolaris G9]
MSLLPTDTTHNLYECDLVLWYQETVTRLQQRDFSHLDVEHLIEEIESLANRERRELRSRLFVLLCHYLKRLYIPSVPDYRGWEITIREQQRQLRPMLKDSPSLKNYASENFNEIWDDALAEVKANYPGVELPLDWTFSQTIEDLISLKLFSSSLFQ